MNFIDFGRLYGSKIMEERTIFLGNSIYSWIRSVGVKELIRD